MSSYFHKSDLCKDKWEAGFYAQVIELFDVIAASGESVVGVDVSDVRKIRGILSEYARVSREDAANPNSNMTVHVSLFPKEFFKFERILGFAEAGGIPGWYWPDCDDKGHWQAVVERCKSYWEARDKAREEAAAAAAEKSAKCRAEREARYAREAVLLQRIRDYVAACEANGEKVIKKRLVDDEFSYSAVTRVWKQFDAEKSV